MAGFKITVSTSVKSCRRLAALQTIKIIFSIGLPRPVTLTNLPQGWHCKRRRFNKATDEKPGKPAITKRPSSGGGMVSLHQMGGRAIPKVDPVDHWEILNDGTKLMIDV